eukprot:Awhi_evm1s770
MRRMPWKAIRGRCVRYRREDQSCTVEPFSLADEFASDYDVQSNNANAYERPLLCDKTLTCTGDLPIFPHTCVKKRPKNACFQGPW